ncbi:hypothetical protein RclHR1_01620003 [Rhizophagus clarus]|uniref:Protein kinase domain-containing protein n=1 Tax=Rhizophagus clarus TaxID=94130 RepID=A0A2Z6QXR9_9GLOM|nr:hypothetical protein RclHR1_01620003 [Rhizophagus clarus]GES87235.1 hypothetical protein GLOIN_2v1869755 [Rhizophagus clarus]
MSNNTEDLEKLISEKHIEYYEPLDFKNIQQIGKGTFGSVSRATWKNTTRYFALKSFNNDKQTLKEIVKELTLHRKVDIHENIIRFYGVTNIETDAVNQMKKYSLVLEYADNGTLDTYLNNHFTELNWDDKLRLAFQLSSAIECMHCCDIIHRDLHAKNILVHQNSIKLADFGLSKKIAEESSNAKKVFGVIPYMDPKILNDQQYKLNEKSDIYSIGVLMWQISSGLQPFKEKGFDYDMKLTIAILNGLREEIIDETPIKYSNLYKECWEYEPNNRPDIHEVVQILKAIISLEQVDTFNKKSSEENKGNLLENYQTISDVIPDINKDLSIGSSINLPNKDSTQNLNSTQSNVLVSKNNPTETLNVSIKATDLPRNTVKLEVDGFTISDKKAMNLIKKLNETKCLYALKLLLEDLQNEFSSQILIDTLVVLADPTPFNLYYSKETISRLELHLRTWITVLERVCFSPIRLTNELRNKIYNSLTRFAEIHLKASQVIEGPENNFDLNFNYQKDGKNEKITKYRNYNIDFLLIHLRDTLNSLRVDETWFQEIIRKTKELLKVVLNIIPGIISTTSGATALNDNYSILSMLTLLRQGLSFKYPVASYYIDWRIILIIQHNIFKWSESSEKIINKKFGEMILLEYLWSYMERELIVVADKSILNSQTKFDELSNKIIKSLNNTGGILNEPLTLPHTLWFGILDLTQKLILNSTHTATHGLGYYIAIESLNKAPSSFIQFKAIEILMNLYNINNKLFSMIEIDFDQYIQKLNENNLAKAHFQNLIKFIKENCFKDFSISNYDSEITEINSNKGKGKEKEKKLDQNLHFKEEQTSNYNILDAIADEITCPISSEPTDQLCILKCQHMLSLNNFKKLRQKKCPKCREEIENNDVRYISQNTIYKNLYSHLFEAGYILPSIELEDLNNQISSDSDNSEAELILAKKKKFVKAIKLNSNILLQSIFPRISKKQHPIYQNAIKELREKNYKKAEYYCKEFINDFPTDYTIKCILAYIYRCINNYERAHSCLNEAISLKKTKPIAYFIRGEIFFQQDEYQKAIDNLKKSLAYKAKMNNLYIILGNSNLLMAISREYSSYHLSNALNYYNTAVQNNPNNYLCFKNIAYIYEKQKDYSNALVTLNKLLDINKEDSLILCYYGEILFNMKKYNESISYFTRANIIDPENIHNLYRRAVAYFILQEYDNFLSDFNKIIQLNNIAYYTYYISMYYIIRLNDMHYKNLYKARNSIATAGTVVNFQECIEPDSNFWLHICKKYEIEDYSFADLGIINNFNKYMYKVHKIYFISDLTNLDDKYCQFKDDNPNSLTGYVLSFKHNTYLSSCPKISVSFENTGFCSIIWKINVRKLFNYCFIRFVIKPSMLTEYEHNHVLTYEDLLKLEKLGWVEYEIPYTCNYFVQSSIEINGLIDMQIDYVRLIQYNNEEPFEVINIPVIDLNVPEAFKDKYFSRKEMENLLELEDIIK